MANRIPSTVPLPLELVKILEAKFENDNPLPDLIKSQWLELRSSLEHSILSLERFASHPELEARANKAKEALQNLSLKLDDGSFQEATLESFKLYGLLASYGALREQLRVTTLDQTDKLIHACKACEAKRLPVQQLAQVVPSAMAEIDTIVALFEDATDSLPDNIQQGFLQGIRSVQVGISALQDLSSKADPIQAVRKAATDLANGALILQELQSWALDLAKEEQSAVPAVGDFVGELRLSIEEDGQIPQELLEEWNDQVFWLLQERWSKDRHDFFMPRYKKDKLVESLDLLILRLRDLQEYTAQEQDEILYLLEIKFEEVARSGFDLNKLATHPQGWLADYIVAVLSKGVPRPHIDSQIQGFWGTDLDIYGRFLESYLADDDRDHLLDALTEILREVEAQT